MGESSNNNNDRVVFSRVDAESGAVAGRAW